MYHCFSQDKICPVQPMFNDADCRVVTESQVFTPALDNPVIK